MDRPIRIAFLDSWKREAVDGSGTAAGISALDRALRGRGHEVEVIRPAKADGSLRTRLSFNRQTVPRLLRSDSYFDLVVGFDLDGFQWARDPMRRASYVVCLKGIAADESRFSRSLRERLHLLTLGWLERGNARRADGVIVPSRYSASFAEERYGLPPDTLCVVPEAVDLEPFRARRAAGAGDRARVTDRPPTILSVARQYPRKDTQTLIRAMPEVLRTHPGARLVVIGGGPELGRLGEVAETLGLDGAVRFRGGIESDDELRDAYFDADLFCLPSKQEGFGIVFVEAMAAGLPIVGAHAGAVPELVEHGETGLLVPPGDVDALAGAIVRLLSDPEERVRLGHAGISAAETYDLPAVARQFTNAVRPLLPRELRG